MKAEEYIKNNDLAAALETLKKEISLEPGRADLRYFLYQLFVFCGDFDRAESQLKLAAQLDKELESTSLIYSRLMEAEKLRLEVAAGSQTPLILGEPEDWMAWLFEANRLLSAGDVKASTDLRQAAFESMPAVAGTFNGAAFEWIADQDTRYGANLECFLHGKYYWVPFSRVKALLVEGEPVSYTELLYPKATLSLRTGADLDVMLFARYPAEYSAEMNQVALNRMTEWTDVNDYTALGRGQRMFCMNDSEAPVLELRNLEFE